MEIYSRDKVRDEISVPGDPLSHTPPRSQSDPFNPTRLQRPWVGVKEKTVGRKVLMRLLSFRDESPRNPWRDPEWRIWICNPGTRSIIGSYLSSLPIKPPYSTCTPYKSHYGLLSTEEHPGLLTFFCCTVEDKISIKTVDRFYYLVVSSNTNR